MPAPPKTILPPDLIRRVQLASITVLRPGLPLRFGCGHRTMLKRRASATPEFGEPIPVLYAESAVVPPWHRLPESLHYHK
ncbi:MAG: hypothetical protein V2G42_06530 [bacterium JZ-2024 1]